MAEWFSEFREKFVWIFLEEDRWKLIFQGLGATLEITLGALVIGIIFGALIATVRSTWDKNAEDMSRRNKVTYWILKILNAICKVYLTVFRGTPMVVQLLIWYFVILINVRNGVVVAIIAFGLNSAAYVAEIVRGGIMSIDNGQFEAGRSLGFNYAQTMIYIIIPQVFKNVLPTLLNEFITLIKETSVAGYVGIMDLTKAGDYIRGRTYSAFMPLIAVALIYLVLVMFLEFVFGKVERRLRQNER